jgi:hexulose-6-phosphate isomerase
MSRIAIMQGRLLPPQGGCFQCFPRDQWRREFPRAAAAGLDAIEWIYDLQGADVNPLNTDEGIAEIRSLSRQYQVEVVSLCADYFMDRPFVTADPLEYQELSERLSWLLNRCHLARINRIVLPFVDKSRIETSEQRTRAIEIINRTLPVAEQLDIELHLETSLPPVDFASLLDGFPASLVKVNYDSGNSASLGYDVRAEIAAYGARIGSVHIKDRARGGGTVALGKGDADFVALFEGLTTIPYRGDYVLQVARSEPGNEVEWARQNRAFLVAQLQQMHSDASRVAT